MAMRPFKAGLILSALMLVNISLADGNKIGIGVGYEQKAYKGDDSEWVPIPHFELESGPLFIKGLKAGINVWDNGGTNLNLNLGYQALQFKPGDSDGALKLLDKRKSTVTAGVELTQHFEQFFINAALDADILGRSDGVRVDVGAGKVLHMTQHFTLVPKGGVVWANKKHNNYYYGVSAGESVRSGINPYDTGGSFTPYLGIGTNYQMTDRANIFGGAKMDLLPSKVKDSPMVDRSVLSNFAIGVSYEF